MTTTTSITLTATLADLPERTPPTIDPATVADIRSILHSTTVSRFAAEEVLANDGIDALFALFAARVQDNLNAWVASGDWPDRPRSKAEFLLELAQEGELDLNDPAVEAQVRQGLDSH